MFSTPLKPVGKHQELAPRCLDIAASDVQLGSFRQRLEGHVLDERYLSDSEHQKVILDALCETIPSVAAAIRDAKDLLMQGEVAVLFRGLNFHKLDCSDGNDYMGACVTGFSRAFGNLAQGNYHDPTGLSPYRHIRSRQIAEGEEQTLLNSTRDGFPHTDAAFKQNPEDYFALFCIQPAAAGGQSMIWRVADIETHIRNNHGEPMLNDMFQEIFPFIGSVFSPDKLVRSPILTQSAGGTHMRYKKDAICDAYEKCLRSEIPEQQKKIIDAIESLQSTPNSYRFNFQLSAGSVVIINNRTAVHSREPFNDSARHLLKTTIYSEDQLG